MKLGLYLPLLEKKPAGLGIFFNSLLSAFKDKNIEIVIFTEKESAEKELNLYESKVKYFEIIPKKIRNYPRILKKIYRLIWINLSLSSVLKKENITEFISITFEAPLLVSRNVKYGIIIHDLTALFYSGKDFLLERIYLRFYLKHCLKKANYIFVPSKSTALIVKKEFPKINFDKFNIISEGFDRRDFFLPTKKEISLIKSIYSLPKEYFVYSGSLLRHKNLIILLATMQKLKLMYPNCKLFILGPSSKKEMVEIKRLLKTYFLEDNIRHLGYVPRNHLRTLMHCANAFLFPSMSEGFGLSVLEAMACGSYIISSNSTSLPEVLGTAGELIPPKDNNAWLKAMKNSLDPDFILRESQRKRLEAQKRANLFSWEVTADNILNKLTG